MLKLAREPWNPWPNLSPLGMPAGGGLARQSTAAIGTEAVDPAPTAPRYQVLCWSRDADGTIDRISLTSER